MREYKGANTTTDRLIKKLTKKPFAKKDVADEGLPDPDAAKEDVEGGAADEGAEEMPGDVKKKKKFVPFRKGGVINEKGPGNF